ncbi:MULTISPECIES: DUF1839 family protein [Cupriavidus]|uniref:DUF1839 family protein n=1 Tax=Cupriavidus pauculus TaxID=82633 RepID=A0A3G8H968_9BURK|nr:MULTISPECIES: DUF1839 family protein [Cupriavidus]AZG16072.1 DUF1839 family protein [Cupriavidus pauculus]MDT6963870.1 DUF1839 family protein [Cupriavidus sp. SZY C1]
MFGDGKAVRARGGAYALHGGNPVWSHANRHIDLWIELLHGWNFEPIAALPFTVTLDFSGDQFTPSNIPPADLEQLFGIVRDELSTYGRLEAHVAAQTNRGNAVLLEVDSYQLPQPASTYRRQHARACIAIDVLVPDATAVGYYHHDGYHTASGDDYLAIFRTPAHETMWGVATFPQAEVVRRRFPALTEDDLLQASVDLLRGHLARRPRDNPIQAFRAVFPAHLEQLMARGEPNFQIYAASVLRQLGANFELLGRYVRWLVMHGQSLPESVAEACYTMASEAMVMQFRLMRAVISRKPDSCDDCLEQLELAYQGTVPALAAHFGETVT